MPQFRVTGPSDLSGEILVSGAKNAALKILPAAILADSPSTINNVPDILDIRKMIEILESIGAKISFENNTVVIDPANINSSNPDENLVKKLRGSIVLVGALLSKFGQATFTEPGGCLIGARPIDDHLDLFDQLGIQTKHDDNLYTLTGKPQATKVVLKNLSVTATENAILASVLSDGVTTIHIAAAEPEITDLADYLNSMGAKVSGAGTHDITVEGISTLHGVEHTIMPDRIEAGTFLTLAVACNSEITIGPIISDHLCLVLKKLEEMGAKFEITKENGQEYIKTQKHDGLKAFNINTRPYPGFPTDLQSPFAVLATQAQGKSNIFETLFEGRFGYLEQIKKLGGKIDIVNPHEFIIVGPSNLVGATISSEDIRGGAALVIAALVSKGETLIEHAEFVDRGYEKIEAKLSSIGAKIERID